MVYNRRVQEHVMYTQRQPSLITPYSHTRQEHRRGVIMHIINKCVPI